MSHVTLVQTKPGEYEFRLPDIGEGVVEGEVVKWLVAEGAEVEEDQPIVEIMTDKATVEIPSPKSGKIIKLFWQEGQTCPVGQPLVLIAAEGGAAMAPAQVAPAVAAVDADPGAKAEPQSTSTAPISAKASNGQAAAPLNGQKALAAPATRKLARDLGVDIHQVGGTGPHGRVTQDDVNTAAAGGHKADASKAPGAPTRPAAAPLVTSGAIERIPLRGLRKKIAEKMVHSAFTAPHVTTFDEVDMTALVELRTRMKPKAEARGVKLSYMPFIMKAVIGALRKFTHFNASLDDATNEIVVKHDIHLGFAAATDNGLMVPVIKHADQKSLLAIARDMGEIAARTRDGKASLDELTGSTFTISNVGSIGGLFATPIINHPEVAILGVNKIQRRPMERDGQIVLRDMMYLGLSFDHRVIDGSEAVQFLNTVIGYLQDPETLLMEM
jgi:pyruvate dehydrogenase E2 component (dihydrolipoamide acetyltransferase)